jgi:hypothetical protein
MPGAARILTRVSRSDDILGPQNPGLMQKGVKIMALPDTLPAFTPDEYLAFERNSLIGKPLV